MRSSVKTALRRWAPDWLRRSGVTATLRDQFRRLLPHDLVYDSTYYSDDVAPGAERSAAVIATSIRDSFSPQRVVDVGCGTGALLSALGGLGIDGLGLERSKAALRICRARGLEVVRFDLERDRLPNGRGFDIAISTEVAEHIRPRAADRYIELLTSLAPVVILTAAAPGQSGILHLNEQPKAYWIAKLAARSFAYRDDLTTNWSGDWRRNGVEGWYYENLMLFERGAE